MDSSSRSSLFTSPFPFLIIAIATLDLHLTCQASDVAIDCPCPFKQELLSIKCIINITAIASKCSSIPPTSVTFGLTTSGTPSPLCVASFSPQNCAFNKATENCGCTEQNGELNTYTYTFTPNSNFAGGALTCSLCLSTSSPLTKTSSSSCDKIEFDKSCNLVTEELCPRSCQLGLGLGLGLGIPVCIAVGFLVAHFGFHWRPSGCNQR